MYEDTEDTEPSDKTRAISAAHVLCREQLLHYELWLMAPSATTQASLNNTEPGSEIPHYGFGTTVMCQREARTGADRYFIPT